MPPVVAAVTAAITALGVGAATAAVIAEFVVGALLSLGTSLVSKALLGKQGDLSGRGQTLSFRAATPAAQIVYGKTRTGGPILLMTTSDGAPDDNAVLWYFVALAGHEVDSIESSIYFNDQAVTFYDESTVHIISGLGGRASNTSPSDPGGGLGRDNGYAHRIRHYGRYDEPPDANAFSATYNLKHLLNASDTFKGIAGVMITLVYNAELFPAGPPNVSAIVNGRKVYDPRNPAHDIDDPETWEWSDNAALCVADYLRGVPLLTAAGVVQRPYGVQAPDDLIDWDAVIEAANICDESVQRLDGGFEARYTCNGAIDSDVAPGDALKSLLSAMAGNIAWIGGRWVIFAGAYQTPTVTLTDDDQCGPSRTQAKRPRRDLFNGVKGKFKGPKTIYQPTDFPRVTSATFVEQDNGEEIWQDIELPWTDSPSACQRISRIDLLRNRQQIVTDRVFNLRALNTRAGGTIALDDPRKGWVAKPFEIHDWRLRTERDTQGQPYLCIGMSLHETSSGVYDWTVDDEFAFDDAPDTNLPSPWVVAVPGAPGIVEELYQTREGAGVRTRVTVSWADSTEGYFLDYIAEFKLSSASAWTVLPSVTSTSVIITDLAAGTYDFRVKTRNRLGVSSAYSLSEGLTVYGLGATPQTLTGLGIQPLGNQAMLAWTQSTDLDVREGGGIEFRHSPSFAGVAWENATSIREAVPGYETHAVVPLKAGTYVLRPYDSSGIRGDITTVSSKQANVAGFTSLAGSPLTEETAFSGSHSFTIGASSVLKLSNDGLWDDIADLDAELGNIDDLGGLALSGTYSFDNEFDFGAVTNVRLTSHIAATAIDLTSGNIDDRAELIDDWETFDGTTIGGVADAWVEYRQTDDNPAGSPTWTDWMRLDTAEAECRAVQCRAQLRSFDEAYNIEITELRVAAEELA